MSSWFQEAWSDLLPIGRNPDTGGYERFAWTHADTECRQWFTRTARGLGLAVERDATGNLWAWWEGEWGTRLTPGQLVVGSHLDSVPHGGAFDGPLGVVSALAAVQALMSRGHRPSAPLGVVVFAEEEGARFGLACAGSRSLSGQVAPEALLALTDADGMSWEAAANAAGTSVSGTRPEPERLDRIAAFLELHIEQGHAPVDGRPGVDGLASAGRAVGLGSGVWPHGRWRAEFRGRADHAGTTPLAVRDDAMLPFARFVLRAREVAEQAGAVATVGRVDVRPNGTNAIPSGVTAWLDVRAPREQDVVAVVAEIEQSTTLTRESWTPSVRFDPVLIAAADEALGGVPVLATGAGHDAAILAQAGVPTAMVFVRNPTGTSHSPEEHADPWDCEQGVEALVTLLSSVPVSAVLPRGEVSKHLRKSS